MGEYDEIKELTPFKKYNPFPAQADACALFFKR
jgi:hypothetical protein